MKMDPNYTMKIDGLFPIPFGFKNFHRPLNPIENIIIENQERRKNVGNQSSSNVNLLEVKELAELKRFIEQSVNEFFDKVYQPTTKAEIYITQSWSNYTSKGMEHHRHTHANSYLSGVFYTHCNNDKICFFDDMGIALRRSMRFEPREFTEFNSDFWKVDINQGMLIMFPSYLAHSVDVIDDDHERISIAFNTYVRGSVGSVSGLTNLNLK
jgi:uncharacterized protein (TIGR02466 family)